MKFKRKTYNALLYFQSLIQNSTREMTVCIIPADTKVIKLKNTLWKISQFWTVRCLCREEKETARFSQEVLRKPGDPSPPPIFERKNCVITRTLGLDIQPCQISETFLEPPPALENNVVASQLMHCLSPSAYKQYMVH